MFVCLGIASALQHFDGPESAELAEYWPTSMVQFKRTGPLECDPNSNSYDPGSKVL